MLPDEIAALMNGQLHEGEDQRLEAFLPSPMVQNHAAFLETLDDGSVVCLWFGGTLEGKSDISIYASLDPGILSDETQQQPGSCGDNRIVLRL